MNKEKIIKQYYKIFNEELAPSNLLLYSPEKLVDIIYGIIPQHIDIEISTRDDIDALLSIYPMLYQYVARLYAYSVHYVRKFSTTDKKIASLARDSRDVLETMLKTIKLQYDSVSRRITLYLEERSRS